MKKTILILFLSLFCFVNPVLSQSKTPYQQKVDQIMTEMCEAIGVKSSLIQIAKKSNDWDIVKNSQDFSFKCKLLEKEELLVIILATDKKLKNAEKLKNDEDFRREQEKEDNLTLKKELELKERLSRFSDFSKLKSKIKSSFSEWVKKDEFETETQYQKRISRKEIVIDSMVFEFVDKQVT